MRFPDVVQRVAQISRKFIGCSIQQNVVNFYPDMRALIALEIVSRLSFCFDKFRNSRFSLWMWRKLYDNDNDSITIGLVLQQ